MRRRPTSRVSVPLTALIDVVFLLLVYFLLTSSFVKREAIPVSVPEAKTGSFVGDVVEVSVLRDGTVVFQGKTLSEEELRKVFVKLRLEGKRLVVRADADAPLKYVVFVVDEARDSGIEDILLATQRKK